MRHGPGQYRSRAIRAIGLPNLPNAPSVRALAQRELRNAGTTSRRQPSRQTASDGPGRSTKADRRKPSKLVAVLGWFTVLLGIYLLFAACSTEVPCPTPVNVYGHSHCR